MSLCGLFNRHPNHLFVSVQVDIDCLLLTRPEVDATKCRRAGPFRNVMGGLWKAGTSKNRNYSGGTFGGKSHFIGLWNSDGDDKNVPTRKTKGALECPMRSSPPITSSSPAPHLCEEGQPKNAGAQPRIVFACPSPTRVGAGEDEVMKGDDLLGLRDCPRLPDSLLVGTYIKNGSIFVLW